MPKKVTKNRAKKYDEKVKVNGTFKDLMDALFPKSKKQNEKPLPRLSPDQKKQRGA